MTSFFLLRSKTVPLKLNEQRNLFKLFLNDIGLLASQYASGIQMKLLNDEISVNYGAIIHDHVHRKETANAKTDIPHWHDGIEIERRHIETVNRNTTSRTIPMPIVTTVPKLLSLSYHSFGTSVTTAVVRMWQWSNLLGWLFIIIVYSG